jgi:hypothetical protein
VFIDSDYSQIELVVLAHALDKQFHLGSTLADLINSGQDLHRLIAAAVVGKPPEQVTKEERNMAKPVSFGRPGGMGADRLQRIAKNSYGINLTVEQVDERIDAYERLCPELEDFLKDERDTGLILAKHLGLTPRDYEQACFGLDPWWDPTKQEATGWLGGKLLKVLGDEKPVTRQGQSYTPEQIAYFWEQAQGLRDLLKPELHSSLEQRRPSKALWNAVRNWAGRRAVFTLTGRLRANATFCSARNCVFQGPAADGAILGLWRIWRAGHRPVSFIHDQVVVESPADAKVGQRVAEIEDLMKQGMNMVLPGMLVKVETVITRSLHKQDLDPVYLPPTAPTATPPADVNPVCGPTPT